MSKAKTSIALLVIILIPCLLSAQFDSSFSSPGAGEQFRLGVQSYHRGRYAESIMLFEKALAYDSHQSLVSYWLGRAYRKNGNNTTALRIWNSLLNDRTSPPFFRAQIEWLEASRIVSSKGVGSYEFVEAARFDGLRGEAVNFLRPSTISPLEDGSVLVVAHGSNEILRIDANGVIKSRERGGLKGFDRPFGLAVLPDGTKFVTEFNGDRVSKIGTQGITTFGEKGNGSGQMLGPQYAASDEDGYIYISDYGNSRILKFDEDGNFVLAFGFKSELFPGFISPSGIVERDGIVYVADNYKKAIFRFDRSGNFLGAIAEGQLHSPESLAFWLGGAAILIADTDRIVSLNLDTEKIDVVYLSSNRKARIIGAATDYNGNLLACDFDSSAILVLTESTNIAAGYDVEIERIIADEFPKVVLDVSIKDRNGIPVVGLSATNFHLSERIQKSSTESQNGKTLTHMVESLTPVSNLDFLGSSLPTSAGRSCLLVEASPSMDSHRIEARDAISELFERITAQNDTSFSYVSSGKIPALEVALGGSLSDLTAAALDSTVSSVPGRFEAGLRLAALGLLPTGSKDSIIYIGTGLVDNGSFAQETTMSEMVSFLSNNGIKLYCVILGDAMPSPILQYLVEGSGGSFAFFAKPRGLSDLAAKIVSSQSGRYRISFQSIADPGFGEKYLSVAVEAYLYKKSGRDELGYYSPIR